MAPIDEDCTVSAYLLTEEGSVPLYADPDSGSQRVGEIPSRHIFTRVDVDGRSGKFVHVTGAEVAIPKDGESGGPLKVSGWLDARVLRVGVEACMDGTEDQNDAKFHKAPRVEAPVVFAPGDQVTTRVVGCSDTWWKLDDTRGHVGWVPEGQWCDNAVTNCIKGCPELRGH